MPKVAQYDQKPILSDVVQQQRAKSAPAGAFGLGDVPQALAKAGQQYVATQQRIGLADAKMSFAEFQQQANNLLYNDTEEGTAYYNTQGKYAVDGAEGATKALEDLRTEFTKDMGQYSLRHFNTAATAQIAKHNAQIGKYASNAEFTMESEANNAAMNSSAESAVIAWSEGPDVYEEYVKVAHSHLLDELELRGKISAEKIEEEQAKLNNSIYGQMVQHATQADPDAGQAMFDLHDKKLTDASDRLALTKGIERARGTKKELTENQKVQLLSQQIHSMGLTVSQQQDEIDKVPDETARNKLKKELTHLRKVDRTAEAKVRVESWGDLSKRVQGGESFSSIHPDELRPLSRQQQQMLHSGNFPSGAAMGGTFNDLMTRGREWFKTADLSKYAHQVSADQLQQLQDVKTFFDMPEAAKSPVSDEMSVRAEAQIATTVNNLLGNDPGTGRASMDKEEVAAYDNHVARLHNEIRIQFRQSGEQITSTGLKKILSDYSAEVSVRKPTDWVFDTDLTMKNVQDNLGMSDDDMNNAVGAVRSQGKALSAENVYNQWVRDNAPAGGRNALDIAQYMNEVGMTQSQYKSIEKALLDGGYKATAANVKAIWQQQGTK